jgi:hypothetical protein
MISTALPAVRESWHHGLMAKRPAAKRDFMQVARGIVEQAIGERMDGSALPDDEPDKRNPHAVALGRMGGKKGGTARAKSLSAKRRVAIAKKAAIRCKARKWDKLLLESEDKFREWTQRTI